MDPSIPEVRNCLTAIYRQKMKLKSEYVNTVESAKEKYPEDMYGLKWMRVSEKKRENIMKKLNLYNEYSNLIYQSVIMIEGENDDQ